MGVDVHVVLIDRRAYARLAEIHRRWLEERDAAAVLSVLREALDRVRRLAPSGKTRRERMHEIERRIDALPTPPADEEERTRFEQSVQEASRRAFAARALGDPAAIAREMEEAAKTFLGAAFAPLARNDQRGALLRELLAVGEDPPGPEIELVDELESAIAAFSDPFLRPEQRDRELSWHSVLNAYAFAWDREPRADVVVDLLLGFESSNVLEDLVGFAKGDDIPLGEGARFFTAEQVAAFHDDLARTPVPAPKAPERVARVRRLVELAASDPEGLALASWVG
jgi:hypothetical protein